MSNPARQFDSLTYANELREAGVSEKQANLQARALFRVVDEQLLNKQDLERLEVKLSADIKEVKTDVEKIEVKLSGDIKELKADIKADIKDAELRLVFRLTGIITFLLTLMGALFKFLPAVHL